MRASLLDSRRSALADCRAEPTLRRAVIAATAAATTSSNRKSCVVIGGGIGGLVAAGKLAQEGFKVTLLEKNDQVGGRCQSVWQGGYRFDTGPSLLLFPDEYKRTFEWLGSRLEDHVQLAKVEPAAYRVFFADGDSSSSSSSNGDRDRFSLDLLYDVQAMVQQLEQVQEGAGTQYLAWLAEARKALVVGTANFIARDFDGLLDFLDLRRLLPLLGQVDILELLGNHHGRLMQRFGNPRIAALLSFQDLYVGLSPYNAPGVFSLLAATEITDAVWYPVGGFGKVRDGLLAVAEAHGVDVRTSACVEQISSADGAVTGVRLVSGEHIKAQLVVTNRDVSMSYGLCDDSSRVRHKQQQLAAKEFSAGVIAFYWCVNKRLDTLCHHNVFLSDEYQASWQRARTAQEFVRHPNFYLHAPARTDPTAAPKGCDSIMVLLPVANVQQRAKLMQRTSLSPNSRNAGFQSSSVQPGAGSASDYQELVSAGRQLVLDNLAAAGVPIQEHDIMHETVRDPAEWKELYALEHGAAFGLGHGLDQLAVWRPPVVEAALKGLYFVGASTRPGNGVPLVMMSGRIAAERILKHVGAGVL